jgi:sterol desaturase/sphingolipid hydroxylase (fatty acid hydroxylase superfamily)
MTEWDPLTLGVAFVLAFPVGTLCEYIIHRFVLHSRVPTFISRGHGKHHESNRAGALLVDFRDFSAGILPFGWLGFLFGIPPGVAFLTGGFCFVFCLALIHKLNHTCPELIFWMRPNSHTVHHEQHPGHNYGITSHFWDLVFGTYARPGEERVPGAKP